jgi:hypothetical protein
MEGSGSQALTLQARRQNRTKPLCFLCVLQFKIFPLPIGLESEFPSRLSFGKA